MTAPAILARLARAVRLDCVRVESGEWLVTGGRQSHSVSPDTSRCDCLDHQLRGAGKCKHILRCQLADGNAEVLAWLRELVAAPTRTRRRKVTAP